MFGLTFEKLLLIGVIAVFILGPDKLPYYASQLAQLVRKVRGFATQARERVKDEMGDEFNDVDWKKLDPRQYDPRRIIRDALLEDEPTPVVKPPSVVSPAVAPAASVATPESYYTRMQRSSKSGSLAAVTPPPHDLEAT